MNQSIVQPSKTIFQHSKTKPSSHHRVIHSSLFNLSAFSYLELPTFDDLGIECRSKAKKYHADLLTTSVRTTFLFSSRWCGAKVRENDWKLRSQAKKGKSLFRAEKVSKSLAFALPNLHRTSFGFFFYPAFPCIEKVENFPFVRFESRLPLVTVSSVEFFTAGYPLEPLAPRWKSYVLISFPTISGNGEQS